MTTETLSKELDEMSSIEKYIEVLIEAIMEHVLILGGSTHSPGACVDWWCKCK